MCGHGEEEGWPAHSLAGLCMPCEGTGTLFCSGGEPTRKESWLNLRLEASLLQRGWRDREGRTAAQRPPAQRGGWTG